MNAGGVDEACKSNGLNSCSNTLFESVADEVVTRRNLLLSQE